MSSQFAHVGAWAYAFVELGQTSTNLAAIPCDCGHRSAKLARNSAFGQRPNSCSSKPLAPFSPSHFGCLAPVLPPLFPPLVVVLFRRLALRVSSPLFWAPSSVAPPPPLFISSFVWPCVGEAELLLGAQAWTVSHRNMSMCETRPTFGLSCTKSGRSRPNRANTFADV